MDVEFNRPEVLAGLQAAFARYEEALVHNRVEVLDELFWDSAQTVRYGVNENLYGIDAIRDFRQARSPAGLARTLQRTVITTYGDDFGTVMTEFRREGDGKLGRQSQAWCRIDGRWQVVAAHVSLIPLPP
jgi:hypothetical protein